ncbi:bifunctional (p)ppGpp synthetase/guanosine-3',5'-bis(diphosphate) 3'-pyrophosphohydrolase [Xanthomonadaceae bacterium JHOS43]|nr:bifunctional (p)ppGpp synthetase/guanosine-3',5'-bis(diphosphate) 3'-pyrophosphohydrolase [Xanthomonadaceae bacterium JHOS43]
MDEWLASARRVNAPLFPVVSDALAAKPLPREAEHEVVQTLAVLDELGADSATLSAAILYVCDPSGQWPAEQVPSVLIEGQREAEKVWSIYGERGVRSGTEGLRRLLLSIVRDLRVVLILLARQLVQLRLASDLDPDARQRLAQISADIHAPLANRLGIWQFKWEMEDLVFRILQPDTYRRVAALLAEKRGDRERFIEEAKRVLREALERAGVHADVAGRPKHIFSIWKKMQKKKLAFDDLHDIRAVRVLVDDLAACYTVLGIVHGLWSPIPSEFDDYIANPKANNYRSLHTVVIGPYGKSLEIQIRTVEMHEHAELGVAAHWRYKEGGSSDSEFERKIAWMRQLLDSSKEDEGDAPLLAGLSTELIEDRVYVLTPQGQVIDLPRGATVLDFAYHVHTEVGHRCRGAKVNGRIVPLTYQVSSGQRVEILTGKTAEPRRDWLATGGGYLASARSRDKVRAWFHKLDYSRNLQAGRELLEKELKRVGLHQMDLSLALSKLRLTKLEDLYVAVALGDVGCSQVARALHEAGQSPDETNAGARHLGLGGALAKPPKPAKGFMIEGVGNLMVQLARCCQPVAGDAILGYLTRGRGVTVHRANCSALQSLVARSPERILPVEWGREGGQSYSVDIVVRAWDRKWLLKDLTTVIGSSNIHILSVATRVDEATNRAELRFTLKVGDFEQLGQLLAKIEGVPAVLEARRL